MDDLDNLALACIHCNRYKGPTVAGIDRETRTLTRLYHPRLDEWATHFRWSGADIAALSPVGRVTVTVLFMNDPDVVRMRNALAENS